MVKGRWGAESPGEPQRLAIFANLLLKLCILRHISAKIQPKICNNISVGGGPGLLGPPPGYALDYNILYLKVVALSEI